MAEARWWRTAGKDGGDLPLRDLGEVLKGVLFAERREGEEAGGDYHEGGE